MKLLTVSEDVPNAHPVHGDGSSLIPFHLLQELQAMAEVKLVTFEGEVPVPREIEAACSAVTLLPKRSGRSAVYGGPLTSSSAGAFQRYSRRNRRTIATMSEWADVTLIHGPGALPFWRDVASPLVIQAVDPWSMRMGMEAALATGLRARYLRARARQFRAVERRIPRSATLLTVGHRDARVWSRDIGRPVAAIPNGVSRQVAHSTPGRRTKTVCFVGSLDYLPNIDSVVRLRRQIAPLVWSAVPDCRFVIAGRRPGPGVTELAAENFEIRGDVAATADIFDMSGVAVFPDRFGLGMRNSVVEALSSGMPVVASATAARELPGSGNLVVRETDQDISDAIVRLLETSAGEPRTPAVSAPSWESVSLRYFEQLQLVLGSPNAK
ncbi:hypothetical protein Ahu01nite_001170 [Winogradskya humida]|uniref:Glycosyltransferase involved in cell wall biosynthesis n=1 Tax=Winogradskya humida TaxID=113566 RepID=A0ABQ3ZEK8_9ACTN|nr:hypothetical protein Ahu01nite_001170 [Actinoplanes humidus]